VNWINPAFGLKAARASFGAEVCLSPPLLEHTRTPITTRRDVGSFDISVLVQADTRFSAVQQAIAETLGPDLIAAHLIDIYADKSLGKNRRRLTFRVVYASSRGEPRTVWEEVGGHVERKLDAVVRGSAQ